MNSKTGAESFAFETEVSQLLNLMIHSLYSEKEVFLRELVSNAADACDKLHFLSLTDGSVLTTGAHADESPLANEPGISLTVDKEAGSIVIEDNGIGMTRDEIISNLGTIARFGEFSRVIS